MNLRAALALLVGLLVLSGCSALIGFDQPAERGVQCSDGVDNDGNGMRDCEESTCADVCSAACGQGIAADARAFNAADGHCYLAFSDAMPALAANEQCMTLGGYLAVPDNAGEDDLIRSVAGSSASLGIADFDYAAGYDFHLVTGDRPAQYLNFSSGQPDGAAGQVLCVSYDGTEATWQDNDCTSVRPYVCEIHPQPCGDFVRQPEEGCDDGNGVAGDGCAAACVDEDECAMGTDNCNPNADCLNQPWNPNSAGFSCQCRGGFVGDGITCTALPPPPSFETRPPVHLDAFPAGCTTGVPRKGHKISVDSFGALYIVVLCGGDATVTVSVDAGATWSAPQVLGSGVFEAAVLGISPGRAVVGMVLDPSGDVVVRQTVDFGMTWQPMHGVGTGADVVPGISLATDGFDVLVGYRTTTNFFRVSRSNGPDLMAFTGVDTLRTFGGDVLVNPQSPSQAFAVGDDGTYHLSESNDSGQSFSPEITPFGSQTLSDWAIGGGFIFAAGAGTDVTRIPVTSTGAPESIPGLIDASGGERSIVAGPDGIAYIAYTANGGVEVARLAVATAVDPAAFIEPMSDSPSIEVVGNVSNPLIAAVYNSLGDIHFSIVIPIRPQ